MENNNPLRLNDIHSEINYYSEWYELFYKKLLRGNEMDIWFVFLLDFFSPHSFSHQILLNSQTLYIFLFLSLWVIPFWGADS